MGKTALFGAKTVKRAASQPVEASSIDDGEHLSLFKKAWKKAVAKHPRAAELLTIEIKKDPDTVRGWNNRLSYLLGSLLNLKVNEAEAFTLLKQTLDKLFGGITTDGEMFEDSVYSALVVPVAEGKLDKDKATAIYETIYYDGDGDFEPKEQGEPGWVDPWTTYWKTLTRHTGYGGLRRQLALSTLMWLECVTAHEKQLITNMYKKMVE